MNVTPIERHGDIWIKRDDLFEIGGVRGGKVRTCFVLAQGARGLVTAGSRASPQINIVASIGRHMGIPVRAHCPMGALSPELLSAQEKGAEIIQHRAGHNVVIIARAREDADARGWTEIPFGMECSEAVYQTSQQYVDIPRDVKRIVVPVGSGMSLCGILAGMDRFRDWRPLLGVVVGADPWKRLERYAPCFWELNCVLKNSGSDYHAALHRSIDGVALDPHYEAKCVDFLEAGDMLWSVGIRETEVKT